MFKASQRKGFQITFKNGNTVSVQFGPGNYCDNQHIADMVSIIRDNHDKDWRSNTAEVAAWDEEGNWHNFGNDNVKGWLLPEEVLEFMNFVANNKLDTSSPFEDDEEE